MQAVFQRVEKKYLLSENQYTDLLQAFSATMTVDCYGRHTISNIYYDTEDFQLIRASIEKPKYKEKLRLRAYGTVEENDQVFLELKKKYDGVVYKRRIPLKLETAELYLEHGIMPEIDSQILREIDYTLKRYHLSAKAYLSYERIAMYGKENPNLRITFDFNIKGRNYDFDLKEGTFGEDLLEKGQVLMEVKIPGAMPVWMSRLFSELGIFPVSYSKYGNYYKKYIIGKERKKKMKKKGGKLCA